MNVKYLLLTTFVNFIFGEDMKFMEDRRICFGDIVFQTREGGKDLPFVFYQNSSGIDELDCATKCYQKLQFCSAVRYDSVSQRCLYSYRTTGSCLPEDSNHSTTNQPPSSVIIYCIRCEGYTKRITEPPRKEEIAKPKKIYVRPAFLSSLSSSHSTKESEGITDFDKDERSDAKSLPVLSNLDQEVKLLDTAKEKPNNVLNGAGKMTEIFTQNTITVGDIRTPANQDGYQNYQPYSKETIVPSSLSTNGFQISSKVDVIQRTPQPFFNHILPVIKQQTDKKLDVNLPEINYNVTDSKPIVKFNKRTCNEDLLLPCKNDMGRDCVLTNVQNCQICICPLKSPARGCSGPQGLTTTGRLDILVGRKTCPNGYTPQPVMRYKRTVDKSKNIDDCILTIEPYCGYVMDVRYWRMPRTKEECYYYCYSDLELKNRNINAKEIALKLL